MDEEERLVRLIADAVMEKMKEEGAASQEKKVVPVGLSSRHLHISENDFEAVFGKGCQLTKFKDLTQPGQFAANEKVDLVGPKGSIRGVRILGPVRKETQIEISITDGYVLGINPPVRLSGDLEKTPGVCILGPKGAVCAEGA